MNRIFNLVHGYAAKLRRRRLLMLSELLELKPSMSVCDVGGTGRFWQLLPPEHRPRVTIVNLLAEDGWGFRSAVIASGCDLPFPDRSFDLVFSNSVIEHVGGWTDQVRFANECQRVGRRYCVQTPNRAFPIEPHTLCPLYAQLPAATRRFVTPYTPAFLMYHPSAANKKQVCNDFIDVQLLDADQLRNLFPGGRLVREAFFGLTKSWVVYGS